MSEKKKNTLVHDAVILFVITVIAAIALGFVYEITKEPIAKAKEDAKIAAYQAVFAEMKSTAEVDAAEIAKANEMISGNSAYEGVTMNEAVAALDEAGNSIGYIFTMTSNKGYGGAITMTMGIENDGTLKGIEFLSISETAGLGMKAKEDSFKSQFADKKVAQFGLAKRNIQGETEVDAISSATITTTAVTRMVNAGLKAAADIFAKGGNN